MLHSWWQRQLLQAHASIFQKSLERYTINVTNIASNDKVTLGIKRNSATIVQFFEICIYEITDAPQLIRAGVFQRLLAWHVAGVRNISGDDQVTLRIERSFATIVQSLKIFVFEIEYSSCCCSVAAILMRNANFFSLPSLTTALIRTYEKISRLPWPPPKNWDILFLPKP